MHEHHVTHEQEPGMHPALNQQLAQAARHLEPTPAQQHSMYLRAAPSRHPLARLLGRAR